MTNFKLYHGENKIPFDEIDNDVRFVQYKHA